MDRSAALPISLSSSVPGLSPNAGRGPLFTYVSSWRGRYGAVGNHPASLDDVLEGPCRRSESHPRHNWVVVSAIIAAAAALVGVFVGKVIERNAEESRWRRDRRAEASITLLGEANDYVIESSHDDDEWTAGMAQRQFELNRACIAVDFFASKALREARQQIVSAIEVLKRSRMDAIGSDIATWRRETLPSLLAAYRDAASRFLDAARDDLVQRR